MSEPSPFIGAQGPQAATDRFLFAVLPDSATIARVGQVVRTLRRDHALLGAPIPDEQLHISLLSLGSYIGMLPQVLAGARWAASRVAQNPFTVQFNTALSFNSRSRVSNAFPAVLAGDEGTIGLETLRRSLLDSMRRLGFKNLPSNFEPHMTLLYDQRKVPEHAVAPLTWPVKEFVLLQRHIGQRRPYTVLGRWTLRGDPGAFLNAETNARS